MIIDLETLRDIAEIEFGDIVQDVMISDINEMRIIFTDNSFLDVWYSLKLSGRYSYHWERRHIDNKIYRHDNAPHFKWKNVRTFPKHFHCEDENRVIESRISNDPFEALREILFFVQSEMLRIKSKPKNRS